MQKNRSILFLAPYSVLLLAVAGSGAVGESDGRRSLWIDAYRGEPIPYDAVLDDLQKVGVVYLGECHALDRHHEIQAKILGDLADRKAPLVLGLEQMESFQQPHLDRYVAGKIDFDELVEDSNWPERWHNYRQYRKILEIARKHKIPVLALNARAETIRQVARGGGVDRLEPKLRKELPEDLQLQDPAYEMLLNLELMVHMPLTAEKLRPVREAQICRDEAMAEALSSFLKSEPGQGQTAVVVCGAGHASYGLGMVSRVKRRLPKIKDRVVLFSQSGDLELTPEEKAMARDIEITHEQLRTINRPLADYLHVASLKGEKTSDH
jgi:aminopeptidase N